MRGKQSNDKKNNHKFPALFHSYDLQIIFQMRVTLNIRRTEASEKIFLQIKQNSARVIDPTRRNFVKYREKDSTMISYDKFSECS